MKEKISRRDFLDEFLNEFMDEFLDGTGLGNGSEECVQEQDAVSHFFGSVQKNLHQQSNYDSKLMYPTACDSRMFNFLL